ncbi:FHA domain-containing protein [Actinotalea ferrariae]|uniref:FHA domain-containing protein n=1 Tax=Actinotalea ferrariae TaxID=1386098 RepID=UPI001C8C3FC4|nr:FHA domain-containing protein [Actinotalea ferrariae]MBX9244634.1 FHA domain-containing protein [Actinotalea ferrariae]
MNPVPHFPRITVTIHADTSGEVTIQGISYPVPATGDVVAARQAAIGVVALRAASALGRAVRVTATDPEGNWPLIVHPSGHVEGVDAVSPVALTTAHTAVHLVVDDELTSPSGHSFLIGRNPQPRPGELVDVVFAVGDPQRLMSKTHARIDVDTDGAVTVTDRDSTNGTTIELHGIRREAIPGRALHVPAGAAVVVGDRHLRVVPEVPR